MSKYLICKPEKRVILNDLICGCIMGGAIGDAFGYPVEFMKYDEIRQKYGENGIEKLDVSNGFAQISDDTQMTLYTANAVIREKTKRLLDGSSSGLEHYFRRAYGNWYSAQSADGDKLLKVPEKLCWIYNIDAFRAVRAPGNTCIEALSGKGGSNDSKGCGGLMRVAPIGCFYGALGKPYDAARVGWENAKLTHGHTLGCIPAAFLSCLIAKIIAYKLSDDFKTLVVLIKETQEIIKKMFGGKDHYDEFEKLINKSIEYGLLRKNNPADVDVIKTLGEGWTAEETLAIAIYSALQYPIDLDRAVMCAINHDGDSDSTGSVTGNIVGAYIGLIKSDVKGDYFTKIEAYDVILEIAHDLSCIALANDFCELRDAKWFSKYLYCTYMQDNSDNISSEGKQEENKGIGLFEKIANGKETDENETKELLDQLLNKTDKLGATYGIDELEEMLGDDGYWDDDEDN